MSVEKTPGTDRRTDKASIDDSNDVSTTVLGRYKVLNTISSSDISIVRSARDLNNGKTVAIKSLTRTEPDVVRVFTKDVQLLADVSHTNLVQFIEYNEPHYVMSYVAGFSLEKLLSKLKAFKKIADISGLLQQLVEPLLAAHRHQVIHGQLNPRNVLFEKIDDHAVVRLVGFGEAGVRQLVGQEDDVFNLPFTCPEDRRDYRPSAQSDVYSVGALAYLALTGRTPALFFEETSDEFVAHFSALLPVDLGNPRDLALLVRKAVAPDVKERYQDIESLKHDLGKWKHSIRKTKPATLPAVPKEVNGTPSSAPPATTNNAAERSPELVPQAVRETVELASSTASPTKIDTFGLLPPPIAKAERNSLEQAPSVVSEAETTAELALPVVSEAETTAKLALSVVSGTVSNTVGKAPSVVSTGTRDSEEEAPSTVLNTESAPVAKAPSVVLKIEPASMKEAPSVVPETESLSADTSVDVASSVVPLSESRPSVEEPGPEALDVSLSAPSELGKDPASFVGQIILDRYVILELCSQSDLAMVYLGNDLSSDEPVALKTLKHPDPQTVLAFDAEVEQIKSLTHPNIVKFLNYEKVGDHPFYIMEFVEGLTISELLESIGRVETEEQIASSISQICDAVEFLEANRLFFGNLKPESILLLESEGEVLVKLAGFATGRVRSLWQERDESYTDLRSYASLQHYRRVSDSAQAPIYEVGAIAFEMVTGRRPFETYAAEALTLDGAEMHIEKLSLLRPDLFRVNDLDLLLTRALTPMPGQEYKRISDLKESVQSWIQSTRDELTSSLSENAEVAVPSQARPWQSMKSLREGETEEKIGELKSAQIKGEKTFAMLFTKIVSVKGRRESPLYTIFQLVFLSVAAVAFIYATARYVQENHECLRAQYLTVAQQVSSQLPSSRKPVENAFLADSVNQRFLYDQDPAYQRWSKNKLVGLPRRVEPSGALVEK